MQRTEEDTILVDLFLACIFICHVNYIKIKANKTAKKRTQRNSVPDILGSSIKFGRPIRARSRSSAQFLEACVNLKFHCKHFHYKCSQRISFSDAKTYTNKNIQIVSQTLQKHNIFF